MAPWRQGLDAARVALLPPCPEWSHHNQRGGVIMIKTEYSQKGQWQLDRWHELTCAAGNPKYLPVRVAAECLCPVRIWIGPPWVPEECSAQP